MSVPAAYLGVILIWTTTPLAIKWSGDGPGFLFGVTGRMVIGVAVALAMVYLLRLKLPWTRSARHTYLAAGLGIYSVMLCVYWSAQFIPSGWISVIFGLSPIATGVMAAIWLGEQILKPMKLLGMLLGLLGLLVIFGSGLEQGGNALFGALGILVATLFHSASAVWVKRLNRGLHGMSVAAGGLLVAAPLFLLTWFLTDASWPAVLSSRALYSILYLALIGSVIGFAMYFYVLRHVEATRVALITLITPVTALFLGNMLNGESVGWSVWLGTALILTGLLSFELEGFYRGLLRRADE